MLFNVMMTFCVVHPTRVYCQGESLDVSRWQHARARAALLSGMSDMLTPIVYVLADESLSYVAYCSLIDRYMNQHFDCQHVEVSRRLHLFNMIFASIDEQLHDKIQLADDESHMFLYRWFLLDCKREFDRFDHVVRVLELIWLHATPRCSSPTFAVDDTSLFVIFVAISILEEDRHRILSLSSDEDLHRYFFCSSTRRSHRSDSATQRILRRAQHYSFTYSSIDKCQSSFALDGNETTDIDVDRVPTSRPLDLVSSLDAFRQRTRSSQ
jgi:hypothetical protein